MTSPVGAPDEGGQLAGLRVSYDSGTLDAADLAPTPLAQFRRWLADVQEAGIAEPNAMIVATATAQGEPSGRTVLLKDVDARGFVFFTNLTSRKSGELAANGAASLVFPWFSVHRQVVVVGSAELLPRREVVEYFRSRPRESQLGAWTSRQSSVIADRSVLEQRFAELEDRFPAEVPVPDFWGGWLIRARSVEFWQGRPSRLHDRLRYRAASADASDLDDAGSWIVERLSP